MGAKSRKQKRAHGNGERRKREIASRNAHMESGPKAPFRRVLETVSRPVACGLHCTDDSVNSIPKRVLETTSGRGFWRSVS